MFRVRRDAPCGLGNISITSVESRPGGSICRHVSQGGMKTASYVRAVINLSQNKSLRMCQKIIGTAAQNEHTTLTLVLLIVLYEVRTYKQATPLVYSPYQVGGLPLLDVSQRTNPKRAGSTETIYQLSWRNEIARFRFGFDHEGLSWSLHPRGCISSTQEPGIANAPQSS